MISINKSMAEIKHLLDCTVGVLNHEGTVIGSTDKDLLDTKDANINTILDSEQTVVKIEGKSYKAMEVSGYGPLVVFLEGVDDVSVNYLELISRCLNTTLSEANKFQLKETFLKNVLLENELPGDITLKARDYDISYATPRIGLVLKNQSADSMTLITKLNDLFPDWKSDYVLPLDENTIVLLLDASESSDLAVYEEKAKQILTQLLTDHLISARIGMGLIADTLKDTAKSYREACLALTVGNIFEPSSYLMRYDRLGLGRLIYQLPPTLCEMFLQEVFQAGAYEALDRETLTTIHKFLIII